ncbi:MAG: hypothetical protein ACLS9Q_17515 [[Clostridium] scindens]|uniref:hypothetical protein n=1 Tax=Clostridium scindens (strain JCM 10418 / VPI 12708) TaxID=29347 RepID=UPI003994B8D8
MKKKITDLLDDIPVDLLDDIELGKKKEEREGRLRSPMGGHPGDRTHLPARWNGGIRRKYRICSGRILARAMRRWRRN